VESLLRREFDRIARDRRSGAAELALRAARAVRGFLRRSPKVSRTELAEIARALLHVQPEMAPLLRLANEAALAAEAKRPQAQLAQAFERFERRLHAAPGEIARHFGRALPPNATIVTYSYSSTVLAALVRTRENIAQVYCAESRPGNEGRVMAAGLARARVRVTLMTDAALFSLPPVEDHIILGADRITRCGFVNKIGSERLVERARRARRPPALWLLADTSKFLPDTLEQLVAERPGPPGEIWLHPPRGVVMENPYFQLTPFAPRMRILSERGWMEPWEAARAIEKIRVAALLCSFGRYC
jgi:translation initiation factor 2B subunit (eIF-2B alpha/beta/delta family)